MAADKLNRRAPIHVLGILAFTQIAAWGSIYYAFAIVAPAIARDLGTPPELVYGAYAWSLLVAGLAATPIGMLLDRHGGRAVMSVGSAVAALGLALLSRADSLAALYCAWSVLGLAMSMTLYEAAFATLTRKFPDDARQRISTLTLFGGLASTVFWPLSWKLESEFGWRATYFAYALLQLLVCLPLHALLGREQAPAPAAGGEPAPGLGEVLRERRFWFLALAFAASTLTFSALSVHLLALFGRYGHGAGFAVAAAALIGPMQVAGRLLERTWWRHWTPRQVGMLSFAGLPAALLLLLGWGSEMWAVGGFCLLYGVSNGVLTIVRGTLPRSLYGATHYGAIAGAMAGPALLSKAAGPILGATLAADGGGAGTMVPILLGCSCAAIGCYLAALRRPG